MTYTTFALGDYITTQEEFLTDAEVKALAEIGVQGLAYRINQLPEAQDAEELDAQISAVLAAVVI